MRVLCTLPNCSDQINGHRFSPVPGGMVSDDLPDDEARAFCTIPGYAPYHGPVAEPATGHPPAPSDGALSETDEPEPTGLKRRKAGK
jgi:hypothetical protein